MSIWNDDRGSDSERTSLTALDRGAALLVRHVARSFEPHIQGGAGGASRERSQLGSPSWRARPRSVSRR